MRVTGERGQQNLSRRHEDTENGFQSLLMKWRCCTGYFMGNDSSASAGMSDNILIMRWRLIQSECYGNNREIY